MIQSFSCKKTQRLFEEGVCDKKFRSFKQQAEKRLNILHASVNLYDLMNLKSNRFEVLSGNREGQFSISINMQWRIFFKWNEGEAGPSSVAIVDCH
jgi:proteic killer suppression protein